MASLTLRPNGQYWVQFRDSARKSQTIRLPSGYRREHAEKFRVQVEWLRSCQASGEPPPPATADWLAQIPDELHAKLAAVGLALGREDEQAKPPATLGEFLDGYLAAREGAVKPSTMEHYRRVVRDLKGFYGESRELGSITAADARELELQYKRQEYASATIARRLSRARQMLAVAVEAELLDKNPFAKLGGSVKANKERQRYIPAEMVEILLESVGCPQWRLMFALYRFAGFRAHEPLELLWEHILWDRERMSLHSRKTGHRFVPIFPKVRPYLEELQDIAGADPRVVTRFKPNQKTKNFATQATRFIEQAGLEPWPKPLQNLRASCETDLMKSHPIHVVCAWIGNSVKVAAAHYLQVTEEDFAAAAKMSDEDSEMRAQLAALAKWAAREGVL